MQLNLCTAQYQCNLDKLADDFGDLVDIPLHAQFALLNIFSDASFQAPKSF